MKLASKINKVSKQNTTPASNLPSGIYQIKSIKYPMANAYYKATITESSFEAVQIELAVLFHPQSSGPKERKPTDLLNKIIHISESGTKSVSKDFQAKDVDYAIWRVLNKDSRQALIDQQIGESKFSFKSFSDTEKCKIFNLMKEQKIELAPGDEVYDQELENDMGEIESPEESDEDQD